MVADLQSQGPPHPTQRGVYKEVLARAAALMRQSQPILRKQAEDSVASPPQRDSKSFGGKDDASGLLRGLLFRWVNPVAGVKIHHFLYLLHPW